VDGAEQNYGGNTFRLTPEHSVTIGFNARIRLAKGFVLFAVPNYTYQSKIFFEDANTPGLEQPGYGLLNFQTGIEFIGQKITLAFYGRNLLDEKYIVSAGNTGSLFGAPTQIPGPPRMFGTLLTWRF
jgi:iron complex outermembrane receptor protein